MPTPVVNSTVAETNSRPSRSDENSSAISQRRRDGKCSGMLASWSVTSA